MKIKPTSILRTALVLTLSTTPLASVSLHAQEEAAAETSNKLAVGSAIPAFEDITWLQGEPIKSLDAEGKVYMLELWATWCGPCVQIIPHVNEWHKKYKAKGSKS